MQQRPLVRSALSLMAAGAFARAFGTLQRILIVRLAGAEALGLFQMVLPVLRMAATLSTLRLPVALTRVTADRSARGDLGGVRQARTATAVFTVACCAITTLILIPGAHPIARYWLTDVRTESLLYWLPLAFVPSALTGIFRGFAEGRQVMTGTVAIQVVEPVVRLVVLVALLYAWSDRGVAYAALALVISLGVSEIGGLVAAAAFSRWWSLPHDASSRASWSIPRGRAGSHLPVLRRRRGERAGGDETVVRELFTVAIPLWLTTMVNTIAQMINVGLIPRRLMVAGLTARQATEAYGHMTGMIMPLVYMPMVLVFPISTVLMPALASRIAADGGRVAYRQFLKAIAASSAVGVGTSAVFFMFPELLMRFLYGTPEIASLVRIIALAPVFVYTGNIFATVLHALGKTNVLLGNFVAATTLRLVLVFYLTSDPTLGIAGALWALNADYVLTALLNGWAAWRLMRNRIQ